ncbi:amino acid transporter-like protein [Setomelanomma holmii]|uniref:Amino acid transporter-like protein n=1 Tax=Setomelanomma holmii TaxID=210430 RepID=A0A9P4GV43_9PLEO|nr:amino acid transporter-like protein [Setomelanomma holmii]
MQRFVSRKRARVLIGGARGSNIFASWEPSHISRNNSGATIPNKNVDASIVREKNAQIGEQVYVDGRPVYQDANGAPVEQVSPLGYHVGWAGILFLNVSQMVGTGVFSTPGAILRALDSVGLSILYWIFGFIIAAAALAIYLEYTSLFPYRSGGQVAYLEQASPRPLFFFPVTYAFFTVAFSFASSNVVVLARYIYRAAGYQAGEWANKGLAMVSYTFLAILIMNLISIVKLIILLFLVITGFVVLGGGTRVENPRQNFHDSFDGITNNENDIVNTLISIKFADKGYENAFNVVNEIRNLFQSIKRVAPISLLIVFILYTLANVAYFAAVPAPQMRESGELAAAALFFEAVFGSQHARGLPALIAISAAGNIMSVFIGSTRQIRECARQGMLPWPHVWASTQPFGTPFAPILLKWALTCIVILALPFGNASDFLVDLRSYPDSIYIFLMAIGIYSLRHQRKKAGLSPAPFQAWHFALVLTAAVCLFILIMPWYPPEESDVNFWYATYCVALPKWGKYEIRTETLVSEQDGSVTHRLRKVKNSEVQEWDRTHDEAGNVTAEASATGVHGNEHLLRRNDVTLEYEIAGKV